MEYLFASRHKGPRFKSPGGYLSETRILLLAMSRYSSAFILIRYCEYNNVEYVDESGADLQRDQLFP